MNTYKLLLLAIVLLVATLSFADARQRANKHEDIGLRTGMERLDMFLRARRHAPLQIELLQNFDVIRTRRDTDPEEKHKSSGII